MFSVDNEKDREFFDDFVNKNIDFMFRDFLEHPEYKGKKFTWKYAFPRLCDSQVFTSLITSGIRDECDAIEFVKIRQYCVKKVYDYCDAMNLPDSYDYEIEINTNKEGE